jgi:hypothetical protein
MRKYNKIRPLIEQPDDPTIRYIPLTRSKYAIVNASDYEWLMQWNWFAHRLRKTEIYYAVRMEGRRLIYMHRRILGDDYPETDHENRNTLDNRRENLRRCERKDNQANRIKNKRNTSGYKGVSWSKSNQKWQAQTSAGGKHIHLGFRDKPEDAYKLYCDFVFSIKGEFACF